ncbi:MAG: DUF4272 domain-containing protein [Lachnospiraceae bacterium]|nr:DUF4272 domain-containing protein [Lachnospiraceae bacterium]
MEINQIHNSELKESLANAALGVLMQNDLVKQDELEGLGYSVGYLFSLDDGQIEGLFKITVSGKDFPFAAQKGKLMMLNIDQSMYEQTVAYMEANHPCLSDDSLPETEMQKARREKNNAYIREQGIAVAEKLISFWEDEEVALKTKEEICMRAMACFFVIQIACDIGNGAYEESMEYFAPVIDKFGVTEAMNSKEKRILNGTYSMQDAIDMDWAYEAYWALCWCLGLVDDIRDAGNVCDCEKAIEIAKSCDSVEDLVQKSKLRSKEEILDMLDLYVRYNWAINEEKVNPEASTGDLDGSIVIERRRGLEWVVSEIADWYDLSMHA